MTVAEAVERCHMLLAEGRFEEGLKLLIETSYEHSDPALEDEIAFLYEARAWTRCEDRSLEDTPSYEPDPECLSSVDHVHIRGDLPQVLAPLAKRQGVRCFRCPADRIRPPSPRLDEERAAAVEEYHQSALNAISIYAAARLRSTECFGGAAISGFLTAELLLEVLQNLPEGLTELMVHPGLKAAESGFEGPEREAELEALIDPRVKALMKKLGVGLTTFGKL